MIGTFNSNTNSTLFLSTVVLTQFSFFFQKSILNTCDSKTYLNIGLMYYDLSVHEKTLDGIIELIQKDQFDESSSLEQLEKMSTYLQVSKLFKSLNTLKLKREN
jgi:hypothetical protein